MTSSSDDSSSMGTIIASSLVDLGFPGLCFPPCSDDDAYDNNCQDNHSTDNSDFIQHKSEVVNDFAAKSSTAFEILARIKKERMAAAAEIHNKKVEITNLSDQKLFDKKLTRDKSTGRNEDIVDSKRDSITADIADIFSIPSPNHASSKGDFEHEILDLMCSDDNDKSNDCKNQLKTFNQLDSVDYNDSQTPPSFSKFVPGTEYGCQSESKESETLETKTPNKKRPREEIGKISANSEQERDKLRSTRQILAKKPVFHRNTSENSALESNTAKVPNLHSQNMFNKETELKVTKPTLTKCSYKNSSSDENSVILANIKSFQNESKIQSKDITHGKAGQMNVIILSSSGDESSLKDHPGNLKMKDKSYDVIATRFEEKKINGNVGSHFHSPNNEIETNDTSKDVIQNDLSFFPEPILKLLCSEQINTCEQLIEYETNDLAQKLNKNESFKAAAKFTESLMVDGIWFATKFVEYLKERTRSNSSSDDCVQQSSKAHIIYEDSKIDHCVSSVGAKFLKENFGITTISALLNFNPKQIAEKLATQIEFEPSSCTLMKDKVAFCYGMVNAWFDVATNKEKTLNSSNFKNKNGLPSRKAPPLFYRLSQHTSPAKSSVLYHKSNNVSSTSLHTPNIKSSLSTHRTKNTSSLPLHESFAPQHLSDNSSYSTQPTATHYPSISPHTPVHGINPSSFNSSATPLHKSSSRPEDLPSNKYHHNHTYHNYANPRSFGNSMNQNYNAPNQRYSNELTHQTYRNQSTMLNEEKYFHHHPNIQNGYINHAVSKDYQDKNTCATNVLNQSQNIQSNFRRQSSKLLREAKIKPMTIQSKDKNSSETVSNQYATREWMYPMNNEEISFLLSKGINTNKKLAKANLMLLAFHFDKFRSLKGAKQREKSISIVNCWIRSAQKSSTEGKSFPIVNIEKYESVKYSKSKKLNANFRRGKKVDNTFGQCDSLLSENLITSNSLTPTSQKSEVTLLDNIKSLCCLTLDMTTGLPRKLITSYDCINDIIYEFLIDIRESSISGAGYGAFLTYKGAKVLNPRCKKITTIGDLAKTRKILDAALPDGKSGVHVTIHGKDIHCDRINRMGPDNGIGLWKEYSPDDFIPQPGKKFCSFDQGSGLVEIGRYGPLLPIDRKTDLEFVIKDFIFSFEPSSWRFDVPENLRGCPQVIDFTSDITGEPHDEACRNIAMYVNEVGHNEKAIENVVSRDNTRTVSYYLLQEKPLEQGTTIELLTDYKSWYENVRERKGYGKSNIFDGVKSDSDFNMRMIRNVRERYLMDTTIRSYNEDEISDTLRFIKSNILDGVLKATGTHNAKTSSKRKNRIALRQWVARRRLHWISILLKSQLDLILSRHGGTQWLLKENINSNLGDPTAFPFTKGMLVFVNGWAGDSRANYFGVATVEKVLNISEKIRHYSLSLDRGRYIHNVPEGVLTHPTKDELSQVSKRAIAGWTRIKEQAKRPNRTRENVKILKEMQWEPQLTKIIFDGNESGEATEIYDIMVEEISDEILSRLSRERKLTNCLDSSHWCVLSTELLRKGLQVLFPFFIQHLGTDSNHILRDLLKLAREAMEFIRSLTKNSSQPENGTNAKDGCFSTLKGSGLKALSFTGDKFLENDEKQHDAKKEISNKINGADPNNHKDTKAQEENPVKSTSKAQSESYVVVRDGTHSPLKDKAKLMGGGKKLLSSLEDGEKIHVDWYIIHQVISTVHALALILPSWKDENWSCKKLCEELGIDPSIASLSYAAA